MLVTSDLAAWLHEPTLDESAAAQAIAAAEAYLSAELGILLEETETTISVRVHRGDEHLPLPQPCQAITAVAVSGTELVDGTDYEVTDTGLVRRGGWGRGASTEWVDVLVRLTAGWAYPPEELRTWALVLAAQVYVTGPTPGVQAERIDDYSVTYATGPDATATLGLPGHVLGPLRARYGSGAHVTGWRA